MNESQEAKDFDRIVDERIKNGWIPDLQLTKKCDYFYNNTWSHPTYVSLDMGEQFEKIHKIIEDNKKHKENSKINILEVGCGVGFLSLELSRHGYNVYGIDVSPRSIEVANYYAENDPFKLKDKSPHYICGDFMSNLNIRGRSYDFIIFLGTLHHFSDMSSVMMKIEGYLDFGGIVICHEPTRDRVTMGNVMFIRLIQTLLSAGKGYYKNVKIPEDDQEFDKQIIELKNALEYKDAEGNKLQSVNDNESGYKEMKGWLDLTFNTVYYEERYAFFHELIGGLRFDEETNIQLAKYLRDMDKALCKEKVLQSTEFLYAGRRIR